LGKVLSAFEPLDLAVSSYTLPFPHLSPWQVLRYQECAACYEEEYVNRCPRRISLNFPIGAGVHAGIAYARRDALNGSHVLDMDDVLEAGSDRYALGVLGQDPLDPDPPDEIEPDWTANEIGKGQDQVREILSAHTVSITHRDIEAGILAVEQQVDFDDVFPFPFKAYLDLRVEAGIVELKTAARKGTPRLQDAFQTACYGLPEFIRTGQVLGFGIDKIVKNKTSLHAYYAVRAGAEELQGVYDDVLQVAADITAGRFPVGAGRFGVHDFDHARPVAYFIGGDE
jgi:hypothetical protein